MDDHILQHGIQYPWQADAKSLCCLHADAVGSQSQTVETFWWASTGTYSRTVGKDHCKPIQLAFKRVWEHQRATVLFHYRWPSFWLCLQAAEEYIRFFEKCEKFYLSKKRSSGDQQMEDFSMKPCDFLYRLPPIQSGVVVYGACFSKDNQWRQPPIEIKYSSVSSPSRSFIYLYHVHQTTKNMDGSGHIQM